MHHDEHEARLRAELIANVSHDLRMPLVAMRGYLELLARSDETLPSEERRSYVAIALRQCEQLGRLVDELSELARLDSRGISLARERFAVAELASDVVRKFALAAEKRGVELSAVAGERLPLVEADLGLIERVLDNLIDNALRHTPPGGSVRIAIDREGDGVRVRVRDTGAGIAADELPHVFDRHWRGTASGGRAGGGGLGLAIAQRILALHGGRVDVESELARGSCFSFSLPSAAVSESSR